MSDKKTPLNRIHRKLGGKMVSFAGWELPVQYKSAIKEHHAVRQRVGVFDVSHMGQIEIAGPDALSFAQRVTCNDLSRLVDGQAQYSAILTPEGTFLDDIVVYRFDSERLLLCVNAATTEKDFEWLTELREGRVSVRDKSADFVQLAVQGPRAEAVLQPLTSTDLSAIPFYRFVQDEIGGAASIISRTGYTGEKGFELYMAPAMAESVWNQIFEVGASEGITAAGLAARNTLRLEVCYPLYGNDIDESRTPLEAGLGWIVKPGTGFIGEEALQRQKETGVSVKLVGFELIQPGVARDQYPVYFEDRPVGSVSSGGFSPTLGKSIGLTYVPHDLAVIGTEISIDIRGRRRKGRIVKTPFYRSK